MTFLNPAILFGLLAVSLPIAIHLLSKPRLRRVRWAAIRFLINSVQKNRRRVQMEDLLLLILRALIVALLVFIFARPALLTNAPPRIGGLAAPAVILLDNSASMGQSDGVQTRFDQAKTMASDLLGRLEPGSSSALYVVSDRVKALIAKPTQDFATLRRSISQAALTDGGSDLYPGIKTAIDVLKGAPGTHREIFILTDSQMSAWRELAKIRDLQDINKDIAFHVLIVGEKGEDNLAVSGLQMEGTVAAINQPLRCAVTVSNWGHAAALNVPVKLASDNNPPQDEGMIEPGTSKIITLVARFRDSGYHSLTATIPGDRLPSDNQRSLALLVLDQIGALVVEGTTNPDPTARDGFFLSHALVPVSADQVAQYYVKVTTSPSSDLENATLNQYELIFLTDVAQLTPRGAENLRQYVNQGGALVVFPGPATDVAFYNQDSGFGSLLPAKLGPAQDPPAGQKYLSWQSKDYPHPLTALWNKPDSGTLGGVRVTKYFPLTVNNAPKIPVGAQGSPAASAAPSIVVKYADGEPAVVEQSVGKGKVILFSSTATTAWTTLPVHPSFVPLLIRIISFATNGLGGSLNLPPGQPFASPIDSEYAGKELSVLRPGEKKNRIVGEVEAGDQSAFLRYGDTDVAGAYELFVGDDPKPKAVFAIQGDPDESNLAQIERSEIEPLLKSTPATGGDAAASDQPAATGHERVPGQELWLPLALAALLLALVEMGFAHRVSQSK
jgi:hypothetical protein